MYLLETMQRLPVTDEDGRSLPGGAIPLPVTLADAD
jgi:hypothetical protein